MMLTGRRPMSLPPVRLRGRGLLTAVLGILLVGTLLAIVPLPRAAIAAGSDWFVVDVDNARVRGYGWTPNSTVTIAIDDPATTPGPDWTIAFTMGSATWFDEYIGDVHVPKPGDVVVVSGGGHVKTHTVTSLWVTDSNEGSDWVAGFASPGAAVDSWVEAVWITAEQSAVADSAGRWWVSYHMISDLKPGTAMGFREYDVDKDATEIHVTLPVDPDVDHDSIPNATDNCPHVANVTQYDGDGDGTGAVCDDVDRVWGANRYGTSAAVAEMAFERAHEVFIALGTNFPDALVAAAAAGHMDVPVLLTGFDSLPQETIDELVRFSPTTAFIVGGTAAIATSVETQLHNYVGTVVRLEGPDRYATAAAVSERKFPSASRVFLALGTNFPDALVAAAAAGYMDAPVLLTARDHLPDATRNELARLHPDWIYIVGGTAAISEAVAVELGPYVGTGIVRVAGPDRYATAAAVSYRFFAMQNRVFLAYGGNFPDALVAAAAGAHLGAPVLLVDHDSIPSATRQELTNLDPEHHWLVGGTAVIGDDVFNALP